MQLAPSMEQLHAGHLCEVTFRGGTVTSPPKYQQPGSSMMKGEEEQGDPNKSYIELMRSNACGKDQPEKSELIIEKDEPHLQIPHLY